MSKPPPKESWISWGMLWRYSTTQLVVFGSLATMVMPLVAQAVSFVALIFQPGEQVIRNELSDLSWRVFAVDLYVSGLLLVGAKLLTQLFCPERIRRFPFEDVHLVFTGEVEVARQGRPILAADYSDISPQEQVARLIVPSIDQREKSVEEANKKWRECNLLWLPMRIAIAILFLTGSAGTVAFLAWRAAKNVMAVLALNF